MKKVIGREIIIAQCKNVEDAKHLMSKALITWLRNE